MNFNHNLILIELINSSKINLIIHILEYHLSLFHLERKIY